MPSEYVIINVFAVMFDIAVVTLVILEMRRLRVGFNLLGYSIVLYFILRAASRINEPSMPFGYSGSFDILIDVVLLVVLVAVVKNARKLTRGILGTMADARYRELEYRRARRDYTQVVRHRIMNPLTVIRAAAQTLDSDAVEDPEMRRQLRRAIIDATEVLEQVSLAPERAGGEEQELDAVPRSELVSVDELNPEY